MRREDVEDYVYRSYLKALPYLRFGDPDSVKRNPGLTSAAIGSMPCLNAVGVTGSKGKGSVSMMISSILGTVADVGLMTSPHISRFNERIRVNGREISDGELVEAAEFAESILGGTERALSGPAYVSPIGIQAVMALHCFRRHRVGAAVFECGKGARYDDVSNIAFRCSVVNTVFPEHLRELGPTAADIADDKSRLIKRGQEFAFSAAQSPEVMDIVGRRAESQGVPLKVYGRDFRAENITVTPSGTSFDAVVGEKVLRGIGIPLMGAHQARNCAMALAVCESMTDGLDSGKIRRALSSISWPGRMQVLSSDPPVILDACINRVSAEEVVGVLDAAGIAEAVFVVGIPDDKDYLGVVAAVAPRSVCTILTYSSNPHYVFTAGQAEACRVSGSDVCGPMPYGEALSEALSYGVQVVVLGTTSLVSDAVGYGVPRPGFRGRRTFR